MRDSQGVDLEEFKQLREEINNRTKLSNELFSYSIAALGVGFAIFKEYPDALLGLSVVITLFWLLWLDHLAQVFKIASYIALHLAPRLRFDDKDALEWEHFRRRIDADSALMTQAGAKMITIPKTKSTIGYAAVLFCGSAPLMMLLYWFEQMRGHAVDAAYWIRVFAIACAAAIWLFAIYRARKMVSMMKSIDAAILASRAKV
jgi:hypothetical protein